MGKIANRGDSRRSVGGMGAGPDEWRPVGRGGGGTERSGRRRAGKLQAEQLRGHVKRVTVKQTVPRGPTGVRQGTPTVPLPVWQESLRPTRPL